ASFAQRTRFSSRPICAIDGELLRQQMSESPKAEVSKEDLDKLLKLAEDLNDKVEGFTNRIQFFIVSAAAYGLSMFLAVTYFLQKSTKIDDFIKYIAAIGAFFAVLYLVFYTFLQKLIVRRNRELRALREVVALVREAESAVANRQGWNA